MKKFAFIGQAMPKPPYPDKPFGRTKLYQWFKSASIPEENFYYAAVVSYFPGSNHGSHIVPSKSEVQKERPVLEKFLIDVTPDVIVPIGKLAISECFQQKEIALNDFIGKKFLADPFGLMGIKKTIIPLPHPSGASAWYYLPANKILLKQALSLLKTEIN